ncbi:MAG: hypothetical protein D6696_17705 [Acidobacteria bacterium]|nr:MAG: hypothetical protein D6696_17705 [Acidobacteriota bacterium]
MIRRRTVRAAAGTVLAAAVLLAATAAADPAAEDELWHLRNLGKAFYENPTTQYEAVEQLAKALALAPESVRERINYGLALLRAGREAEGIAELEKAQRQDPTIPHTFFNLGIAYKRAARYDDARVQLERMIELVPDEAISHYNLGVLYNQSGERQLAVRHFQRAAALAPDLAGPHYQLAVAYRRAGRPEDAKREMAIFRRLKQRNATAAVPEDLEWSYYAELYESLEPRPATGQPAALELRPRVVGRGLEAASAGLLAVDADGDGGTDLLAYSRAGVLLLRRGVEPAGGGFGELRGVVAAAAGDADGDGLADLALLTAAGPRLFRNQGGRFAPLAAALPAGSFRTLLWLDYDHDYDPDLLLLGARSALYKNAGGAFTDATADFPFADGTAVAATVFDLVADADGRDLAVAYDDRPGVLYRDRLGGRYDAVPLPQLAAGSSPVAAIDLDGDGWTDLVAGGRSLRVLRNDRGRRFAAGPVLDGRTFAVADLDNRGLSDLASDAGVYRNLGLGRFAAPSSPLPVTAVAALSADFDGDGRADLAAVSTTGELILLANATASANRWLEVALKGVKNPPLAIGAEVEIKAGRHYQKKLYQGVPLHFGLGSYERVDTVRITWPNGLIQNQPQEAAGRRVTIEEAARLSGSCPMVFAWDGAGFAFIGDVLGVAPLGASAGDAQVFPADHDEVIALGKLAPRRGYYEIRLTEELREIAYLDAIRLLAVDHPAGGELVTGEQFRGPPFPDFRLYGVAQRHRPTSARDHRGRDLRRQLMARDGVYAGGFARDHAGVAERHSLELAFPPGAAGDGNAVLVLHGWVDWADGSTFRAASQGVGSALSLPRLEARDEAGRWHTVLAEMGIPAGKPRTIAIDLSGKLPPGWQALRLTTNLCLYWDEIYLSPDVAPPAAKVHELAAAGAELRYRGFSRVVVHPQRLEPERFLYDELVPLAMWNPTPGLYTRYGEVGELLETIDDRFVIMGAGDELRLRFAAGALPPPAPGMRRDFLLFVDGWAKDGDANTAHARTVEPLPYHAMPSYPYAPPAAYPSDEPHRRYRERYNTRPALRIIRPLVEASPEPR